MSCPPAPAPAPSLVGSVRMGPRVGVTFEEIPAPAADSESDLRLRIEVAPDATRDDVLCGASAIRATLRDEPEVSEQYLILVGSSPYRVRATLMSGCRMLDGMVAVAGMFQALDLRPNEVGPLRQRSAVLVLEV